MNKCLLLRKGILCLLKALLISSRCCMEAKNIIAWQQKQMNIYKCYYKHTSGGATNLVASNSCFFMPSYKIVVGLESRNKK